MPKIAVEKHQEMRRRGAALTLLNKFQKELPTELFQDLCYGIELLLANERDRLMYDLIEHFEVLSRKALERDNQKGWSTYMDAVSQLKSILATRELAQDE